jgi:hypothetical protein
MSVDKRITLEDSLYVNSPHTAQELTHNNAVRHILYVNSPHTALELTDSNAGRQFVCQRPHRAQELKYNIRQTISNIFQETLCQPFWYVT